MASTHRDRKFKIIPYDPSWGVLFENEASKLHDLFGPIAITIEHIGSTSVPGMAGKPTIDILVLVNTLSDIEPYQGALEDVGYEYLGAFVRDDALLYVKERDGVRIVNLHIFSKDHPHVKEMLAFRDYLRTHLDEVQQYSEFKLKLYSRYANDYGMYRNLKDKYVDNLMGRVMLSID